MSQFALSRTPMYDKDGRMTRQWIVAFSGLFGGGGATVALDVDASGVYTPDLSRGTRFLIVLTADATLALPTSGPTDATAAAVNWTLIVQQDAVGGHTLNSSAYHMDWQLSSDQSAANTESVQLFSTDSTGTRVLGAPSLNQPIP